MAYMNFPKGPEPGPVTEMKPLGSAKEEARRARLLENAAREARERKQNSRPTTAVSPTPPSPAADDTARLLDDPPAAGRGDGSQTPHGLAGMSINDIVKMKMSQRDGPRKPRKIVSS